MMNRDEQNKYYSDLEYLDEIARDPLPADPIARILLTYFDHPYDYIHAKPKKRKGKQRWRTEKRHRFLKRNIWKDWNSENIIIGLGFGYLTRRIMIDIDIDSPYHPNNDEEAYQKLLHTLEDLGLCSPIALQSSWSEGLHIYYFLSKGVPSYYASKCIHTTLRGANFEIKNGHLEVFPNMKQYADGKKVRWSAYKPHRLPLQPGTGSCILSTFSLEYKGESLNKFAHMVEASALDNDVEHFERMIELCRHGKPEFWVNHKKRGKVREWHRHLKDFIFEGWTDYHQTNVLLGKIAVLCHVFDRKQGEELVSAMKELAISLPGYYQYCRHQHEIERRCRDWARSVQIHYRMLYDYPQRQENYTQMFNRTAAERVNKNERKSQETSSKIKRVYDHIIQTITTLPKKIGDWTKLMIETAKELTGSGLSRNTLFKKQNLPLWHPKYYILEYEVQNPASLKNGASPLNDSEGKDSEGKTTSEDSPDLPITGKEAVAKSSNQKSFEVSPPPSEIERPHQETLESTEPLPVEESTSNSPEKSIDSADEEEISPESDSDKREKSEDEELSREFYEPKALTSNADKGSQDSAFSLKENNPSSFPPKEFVPHNLLENICPQITIGESTIYIHQSTMNLPSTIDIPQPQSFKEGYTIHSTITMLQFLNQKEQTPVPTSQPPQDVTPPPQAPTANENNKGTERSIGQESLQPESNEEGRSDVYLTPDEVIRKNQPKSESPKTKSDKKSGDSSHTLALMKCIPEGDSPPEGLSLYEKVKAWFASGQKLRCLRKAWGLIEIWLESGCLAETKMKCRTIDVGQDLIISSIDHSSCWFTPEDEENLLVYVKPISEKDHWKDGLAVRALDLIPIES